MIWLEIEDWRECAVRKAGDTLRIDAMEEAEGFRTCARLSKGCIAADRRRDERPEEGRLLSGVDLSEAWDS